MNEALASKDGVLAVMQDLASTLPPKWEEDFFLGSAAVLAEVVAETRGKLTLEQLGAVIGAGAILLRQAGKEAQATEMTAAVFDRLGRRQDDAL